MQMVKCPSCNEENPAKFRLCGYCGTPLAQATAALPPTELRKTVTLLFTDLKDSTVLGETLDSEAMHEVKERYFAAMSAEIERHGGKIEKYIGDAIMAVFGLPRSHEDDALRAVRAAVGMQKILAKLNKGLKARFGCELKNRTGVNTGEVVTTDDPTRDQKMATGDAVNVTARLEAAAPVNEILIGEVTYRLVRDAVQAEPVEPLTLKGKSQPVPAYKLIAVYGEDGNVRRHEMPVVGREQELAALETAWEEVTTQRQARLVTVIGDAGVGKTRLVREIMDRLSSRGALILSGRALPYGDGITYWPLRGMVLGAATIHQDDTPEQAQEKILACVRDRDVADRIDDRLDDRHCDERRDRRRDHRRRGGHELRRDDGGRQRRHQRDDRARTDVREPRRVRARRRLLQLHGDPPERGAAAVRHRCVPAVDVFRDGRHDAGGGVRRGFLRRRAAVVRRQPGDLREPAAEVSTELGARRRRQHDVLDGLLRAGRAVRGRARVRLLRGGRGLRGVPRPAPADHVRADPRGLRRGADLRLHGRGGLPGPVHGVHRRSRGHPVPVPRVRLTRVRDRTTPAGRT